MRTTVTLDPDVEAKLRTAMRERGVSFKAVINDAVRKGLSAGTPAARPYKMPTTSLGLRAGINWDKALQIAGEMENDEIIRKRELRK